MKIRLFWMYFQVDTSPFFKSVFVLKVELFFQLIYKKKETHFCCVEILGFPECIFGSEGRLNSQPSLSPLKSIISCLPL